MLQNLSIRDFAIIDRAEIDFPSGFTVLTGETGAGKSIVIEALGAVLGGRVRTDMVRAGADTARVEAVFDIGRHPEVQARLEERDLAGDSPGTLLVRRSIGKKGKNRVSINDHLTTLGALQAITGGLVEICGQHEQHGLLAIERHRVLLDAFARLDAAASAMRVAYAAWQTTVGAHEDAVRQQADGVARLEAARFMAREIDQVAPESGELDALVRECALLAHAGRLEQGATQVEAVLYADEGAAYDLASRALTELEALADIDEALSGPAADLRAALEALEAVARAAGTYAHHVESDPARLDGLEERVRELQQLTRKYGGDLDAILARRAALAEELAALEDPQATLAGLEAACQAAREKAKTLARGLSRSRRTAARKLDRAVHAELADMELGKAIFRTDVSLLPPPDDLSASGADRIAFHWTPNPGEPEKPLARIASGGELSRVMLAVKTVLSSRDLVAVYIFDEVDSGMGGKAADSIGRKIHAVAQENQAIVITHLPAVAARADHHLKVHKVVADGRTLSRVEPCGKRERADELARMIDGGSKDPKAARAAARAMLARA